jgi:hypothetical protein
MAGSVKQQSRKDLLERKFGSVISGPDLWKVLGFRSGEAFRQAHHRGRVPVKTLKLPGRQGRFARVEDVAQWLESIDKCLDATTDREPG